MRVDLDKLMLKSVPLWSLVTKATGFTSGVHEVDAEPYTFTARKKLAECSEPPATPNIAVVKQPAEPAPAAQEPPKSAITPLPASEDYDIDAEFKRDIQMKIDKTQGLARLQQFQEEQGLRDCKENADAIRDWLDANCKGYVSQDMIDAAVVNLGARGKNVLLWDSIAPPAAPTPEPTGEALEPWQLPLDVSEYQMKRADVRALQDLIKRRRAASGQQTIGLGARVNRLSTNF